MSEVQFNGLSGNYGFYLKNDSKSASEEETVQNSSAASEAQSADPDKVMEALSFIGAQNYINVAGKMPVDPADYLSEERIGDIEDSIKLFEEGTDVYAEAIKAEFGDLFSEDTVYALAANAFALNA